MYGPDVFSFHYCYSILLPGFLFWSATTCEHLVKVILLGWQRFLSFIEQHRDVTLCHKLHGGDIMVMTGCHNVGASVYLSLGEPANLSK